MTSLLLILAGLLVLLVTLYDLCKTTISLSGSGPITTGLSGGFWAIARWVHYALDTPRLLRAIGPLLALLLLLMWVALSWLGWWLIFSSDPSAVVDSTAYRPASLAERAYFVGYTITTLGYGDFVPLKAQWQMAAIACAINGFTLFTLAVTYWLSIVSSVVQKRKLALFISRLGETPSAILKSTRGRGGFDILGDKVSEVVEDIVEIGQQQRAYPILHYYHAPQVKEALPVSLIKLYVSLQVVAFACASLPSTARFEITTAIAALEDFLESMAGHESTRHDTGFAMHVGDELCLPDFDKTRSDIVDHLEAMPIKPLLNAYLVKEGWQWADVWNLDRPASGYSSKA